MQSSVTTDFASEPKYRKSKNGHKPEIKLKDSVLSDKCFQNLSKAWNEREDFQDGSSGVQLFQEPFCHCVVPGFIEGAEVIEQLQEELLALELTQKNNDLYKFQQTVEDLKTSKSPHVSAFRDLLCTQVRSWLKSVTGIPLNETVDAFCAQYAHTDTLLCHDDELEGRRIAYIYYLVTNWTDKDGGALDLFNVDENLQPNEVVKSILPVRNNFVFFEVSPGSYHQVAEILSEDKNRLSVSGWFHGPPIDRPPPYIEPPRTLHPYGEIEDDVFFDWINPVYLGPGAQGSIQEKFENDSEIELQDFLQKEKYEALLEALKSPEMKWRKQGPANKRCYEQGDTSCLPEPVQTCVNLFQSDAMFLLLSNMTGLKLHELAAASSDPEDSSEDEGSAGEEGASTSSGKGTKKKEKTSDGAKKSEDGPCTARCRNEVRYWKHKYYTLVHDTDTEGSEFALDLIFYVGCGDWEMDYGGFTSYITKGEDEELLTVTPQENSLALVYHDQETLKFVKYLNCDVNNMPNKGFYDISAVYYE